MDSPSLQPLYDPTPFCVIVYQTAQGRVVCRRIDKDRFGDIDTDVVQALGRDVAAQFVFPTPLTLYASYVDPADTNPQIAFEQIIFNPDENDEAVWKIVASLESEPEQVANFFNQTCAFIAMRTSQRKAVKVDQPTS